MLNGASAQTDMCLGRGRQRFYVFSTFRGCIRGDRGNLSITKVFPGAGTPYCQLLCFHKVRRCEGRADVGAKVSLGDLNLTRKDCRNYEVSGEL